jgi:hypothetical protein
MLADHPIDPMILATDLGVALPAWIVDPYGNSIGLLQVKDAEMN